MVFVVKGKVALITGAASGLGLRYAQELLSNGLKGVTIADFDQNKGREAEDELNRIYGQGKAIFVNTDVTKWSEFEGAFKKTIEIFKNVDILINNAGIMNDKIWEKEIAINLNGVINGMFLGYENYLLKHRQGEESVILNISSVAGTKGFGYMPVYCGTKSAVLVMSQGWASAGHYNRTNIRVVCLCPGATDTPLIDVEGKFWSPDYQKTLLLDLRSEVFEAEVRQSIDIVATEAVRILKYAKNGTAWVVENGQPAYEFIVPDRETMNKNNLQEE